MNAIVKPENKTKPSTPRQLRRVLQIYLCHPSKRPTRIVTCRLIQQLEKAVGKEAVAAINRRLSLARKAGMLKMARGRINSQTNAAAEQLPCR